MCKEYSMNREGFVKSPSILESGRVGAVLEGVMQLFPRL